MTNKNMMSPSGDTGEETPDHTSLTCVRDRLPLEVHTAGVQWVLALAAEKKLLPGKTVAIDSTTLEAAAAMKSIIRRFDRRRKDK
jgi:transposase